MTAADYVIIGSGLTGSTIARLLADQGREVLVLERRPHQGGNVFDFTHPSGIRVHTYGPHYFRCSSPRIWEYVNRFARFGPYFTERHHSPNPPPRRLSKHRLPHRLGLDLHLTPGTTLL